MTPPACPPPTAIRASADAVLARYAGSERYGDLLPRICRGEGITLLEADLRDIGGVLRHEGGGWRLYLNRHDTEGRRRFTLAHLLGHFFLHAKPGRTFIEGTLVAGYGA